MPTIHGPCAECGAPGVVHSPRILLRDTVPEAPAVLDAKRPLCQRCVREVNLERTRWSHPRGYEVARQEEREDRERLSAVAMAKERPRSAQPEPISEDQVDAVVPRLIAAAALREDAHPDFRSPNWIGKALEEEGWKRKVLNAGVEAAIARGFLEVVAYRDEWKNRKRALRLKGDSDNTAPFTVEEINLKGVFD